MKNTILGGGIAMLLSASPCQAQEKETATYSVYPYVAVESGSPEWIVDLPEQAEATTGSFIEQAGKSSKLFSAADLIVQHDGKTYYYETVQETFTLWGQREAQVVHTFETPVTNLESLWEQNFSAGQLTFFGKRSYSIGSSRMGEGTLSVNKEQTAVSLIKTTEEIAETALNPYRKVRVSHYFLDDKSRLPLFQTVTDTLYTNGGTEKRVISFSLHRKLDATGIDSGSGENSLKVYPNPTKGACIIETGMQEPSTAEIYDLAGKLQKIIRLQNGSNEVSVGDLAAGTYVLKHLSRTSNTCIKLIKL